MLCLPLPQVIILVQLVVVAVMMGFFAAYHLWLVAAGKTTYETSKWRSVRLAALDDDASQPWCGDCSKALQKALACWFAV